MGGDGGSDWGGNFERAGGDSIWGGSAGVTKKKPQVVTPTWTPTDLDLQNFNAAYGTNYGFGQPGADPWSSMGGSFNIGSRDMGLYYGGTGVNDGGFAGSGGAGLRPDNGWFRGSGINDTLNPHEDRQSTLEYPNAPKYTGMAVGALGSLFGGGTVGAVLGKLTQMGLSTDFGQKLIDGVMNGSISKDQAEEAIRVNFNGLRTDPARGTAAAGGGPNPGGGTSSNPGQGQDDLMTRLTQYPGGGGEWTGSVDPAAGGPKPPAIVDPVKQLPPPPPPVISPGVPLDPISIGGGRFGGGGGWSNPGGTSSNHGPSVDDLRKRLAQYPGSAGEWTPTIVDPISIGGGGRFGGGGGWSKPGGGASSNHGPSVDDLRKRLAQYPGSAGEWTGSVDPAAGGGRFGGGTISAGPGGPSATADPIQTRGNKPPAIVDPILTRGNQPQDLYSDPMWGAAKAVAEQQYALARKKAFEDNPAGGGLLDNMTDVSVDKARYLAGAAGDLSKYRQDQAFQERLQDKGYAFQDRYQDKNLLFQGQSQDKGNDLQRMLTEASLNNQRDLASMDDRTRRELTQAGFYNSADLARMGYDNSKTLAQMSIDAGEWTTDRNIAGQYSVQSMANDAQKKANERASKDSALNAIGTGLSGFVDK